MIFIQVDKFEIMSVQNINISNRKCKNDFKQGNIVSLFLDETNRNPNSNYITIILVSNDCLNMI